MARSQALRRSSSPSFSTIASRTSSTTRAHLTEVTFASLNISPLTKRAIAEVMGYQVLSSVQAQTLPVILQGHDVIAKAKTGTGKTIGFLLPTIERLAQIPGAGIRALAISPTCFQDPPRSAPGHLLGRILVEFWSFF